jgi:ubiquitin conjugation factor E4 B
MLDFVKNPYLKSKLVEVIYYMTYHRELLIPISNHPTSVSYLVHSIMRYYVDVELTGMSSQFYDKFNIRYNISHILKTLWGNHVHRSKVKELSS